MSAERDAGLAALQKGDAATAITALESANEQQPSDYQTLLYLAAAYGMTERHTEAVTAMTQAVTLQPANPQARYNLGVAYERAGWTAEALTAMQQAIQLQPVYTQAQEAIHRLQGPTLPTPAPQTAAAPYGLNAPQPGYAPPAPPGYAPPMQPYSPAPYGQQAPPYGASPSAPSPYGAPQQMPNPGYGAPNAPYGSYAPQAYQAAPAASQGSLVTAVMLCIGMVILCGIGVGYFTYATGYRFPFASIVFGYLFGWFVPKVSGGHGAAQGYIAGAGAGIATLAATGIVYALGGMVTPFSFLLVFYAIFRGYRLASGD